MRLIQVRTVLDTNDSGFARLVMSWNRFYLALTGDAVDGRLLLLLQVLTGLVFLTY